MEPIFEEIKANLFPAAHGAIGNWAMFPWHRDRQGAVQTHKQNSSQALAIDVFGTIKVSEERDRILGALARKCRVPEDGPWALKLEWIDAAQLLSEPTPTQVDAIAFGRRALLVIECKFTEGGGSCSQPHPLKKGPHKGLRQCNGDYELQINPSNGAAARCALTGKGVRYWEVIPQIFGLDAEQDYRPCPFRSDAYQWMRNVVLANTLASVRGVSSAVIAAYAEGATFPTSKKVDSGHLGHVAASGTTLVVPLSYQSIVTLAQSHSTHPGDWAELAKWVDRKIQTAESQTASGCSLSRTTI